MKDIKNQYEVIKENTTNEDESVLNEYQGREEKNTTSDFIAGFTQGLVVSRPFDPLSVMAASTVGVIYSLLQDKYRSLPVTKETKPVDIVSETWKNRPKANIVKWLMQRSNTTLDAIAQYLNCSAHYLNTKLSRDSFSFDDLIVIAYACGFTFVLTNNKNESTESFRVDLIDFFKNSDDKVLERISKIEENEQRAKRREYEKKKAELEKMRTEYGFED